MTILIQYRKFIFFQVIYRALCMLFDEIYVNFANYSEIAELSKVIEHVPDMPKNHYKLNLDHSNTNQKKW